MFLGTVVKSRPIGPVDPRLPDFRNGMPNGPARARIFQEPNEAADLNNSTQFFKCWHLKLIGKRAKQKRRNGTIKVSIRKIQSSDIHLPQLD